MAGHEGEGERVELGGGVEREERGVEIQCRIKVWGIYVFIFWDIRSSQFLSGTVKTP